MRMWWVDALAALVPQPPRGREARKAVGQRSTRGRGCAGGVCNTAAGAHHQTPPAPPTRPPTCRQRCTTWLPLRSRMSDTTPGFSASITSWTCGRGQAVREGGGKDGRRADLRGRGCSQVAGNERAGTRSQPSSGSSRRGTARGAGDGAAHAAHRPLRPTLAACTRRAPRRRPTCSRLVRVSISFCTARVPWVLSATLTSSPLEATWRSTCKQVGEGGHCGARAMPHTCIAGPAGRLARQLCKGEGRAGRGTGACCGACASAADGPEPPEGACSNPPLQPEGYCTQHPALRHAAPSAHPPAPRLQALLLGAAVEQLLDEVVAKGVHHQVHQLVQDLLQTWAELIGKRGGFVG